MYFNGKYSREGKNAYQGITDVTFIRRGKVVSIDDPNDAGRIKVRVLGVDNADTDSEVFYAFPMLPKHINVVPKLKDGVLIFTFTNGNNKVDRMYLGPVIPQPQNLDKADFDLEAWNAFTFGKQDLGPAVVNRKKIRGGYPNKEDIAIQGRKNVDVILKDDELLLRAGKFVYPDDLANNTRSNDEFDNRLKNPFKFNSRTQGYIQIKYNAQTNVSESDNDPKEFGTVTNVVANKINLLTHKEGNPRFNLTNQDNLISDEEMQKILAEAHPLVFGDKLVEFLKLVKNAISNHTHKYPGISPHSEGSSATAKVMQDMNEYDLEQILSKNIRIN
jgi:hypothetical protein